jgi:hypothetical protein
MTDDQAHRADETFLERWMRRKSAARDQETPPDSSPPLQEAGDAQPAADFTDAAPANEDAPDLPDLDTLDQESDYSVFLSPKVDEVLRRKALRQLFHSPKFNICDGLDDYCGDFTRFEPLGDVVTADLRHQLERAAERLARGAETSRAAAGLGEPLAATPAPSGDAAASAAPEPDANDDDFEPA